MCASPAPRRCAANVSSVSSPRLNGSGRLVIRESGTEPLIRVMAEGEDEALVCRMVDELCATIAEATRMSGNAD